MLALHPRDTFGVLQLQLRQPQPSQLTSHLTTPTLSRPLTSPDFKLLLFFSQLHYIVHLAVIFTAVGAVNIPTGSDRSFCDRDP